MRGNFDDKDLEDRVPHDIDDISIYFCSEEDRQRKGAAVNFEDPSEDL